MNIRTYFKLMREQQASDLYVTPHAPIKIRINGNMRSVGREPISAQQSEMLATGIMTAYQVRRFEETHQLDFAVEDPDNGRFRFNVFHQRGMVSLAIRYIPASIPDIESLNLPVILRDLIMQPRGLILLVGATGSGKSTTLAAMLDHRNRNRADHILTIEDPIEFTHTHHRSIINQRELLSDALSYAEGLRSALRAAPDVVMIGEIRDRETMEAALEIAGTGHLALSTLHTNNAHQTLDRIINMFPQVMHKQVLMDLSLNLRAIISQRLVRNKEDQLMPAVEILLNTPHIADLIMQGRIGELQEAMESSKTPGMQTYDQALVKLYRRGQIALNEALDNADSRANLEARINFG